jgi:hypothetical protein
MKLLVRMMIAIVLVATCGPGFAQELRPSIRTSAFAPRAEPLVLARSYGPGFSDSAPGAADATGEWNDTVKQSLGCLIGGVTGTGVALLAGGGNVMNVIAGGGLLPSNPLVLYTGIVGVVFASFCAIGQALTPLYLYHFPGPVEPPRQISPSAGNARLLVPASSR